MLNFYKSIVFSLLVILPAILAAETVNTPEPVATETRINQQDEVVQSVEQSVVQSVVQQPSSQETAKQEVEPRQFYIVEVILFKHLNEEGKKDEFWHRPDTFESNDLIEASPEIFSEMTDDMAALAQYDLNSKKFLPLQNGVAELPETNYELTDSAAHLRYSKDFQLLAHFGWT